MSVCVCVCAFGCVDLIVCACVGMSEHTHTDRQVLAAE